MHSNPPPSYNPNRHAGLGGELRPKAEQVQVELVGDHPHAGTRGTVEVIGGKVSIITVLGTEMVRVKLIDSPLGTDEAFAESRHLKPVKGETP